MPEILLSTRTAGAIDQQIAKVLADLGNPRPPLDLDQVRDLLKLDRGFYSATNTSLVQEVVHRLQIASRQVIARPTRIWDAIRKRSLRALWVPDRKRILIDGDLHALKQRWAESHEITHSLVPHHQILTLGDPEHTLAPACRIQIEAEANYGAGRLLFLRDEFTQRLLSQPVTLDVVRALAATFANSQASTLWRAVETLAAPAFGLISLHPWMKPTDDLPAVRHFIRSGRFAAEFSTVTETALFANLARVVHRRGNGPIGDDEMIIADSNGDRHVFRCECFCNRYDVLTFGLHVRAKTIAVGVF